MENHNQKDMNDNNLIEQTSKRSISIFGVLIPLSFTLLLSVLFSFISMNKSISNIEGRWVRLPDDNADAYGMVVEVKSNGPMHVGEVVDIDDGRTCPIGSIKWNGFQKDGLSAFAYYDMMMSQNPAERRYSMSYALVSPNGKELRLYSPEATVGSHQVWIREENDEKNR